MSQIRCTTGLVSRAIAARLHPLHTQHVRRMANRFPRRTARPGTSVATRAGDSVSAGDALASSRIEGTEAQVASIRLSPSTSIKVDPSCIVSVPLGVEVRPIYGAPQPLHQQQTVQQSGGFLSRLRESPKPAEPAANAVMLAEVLLQPGQPTPQDSVHLSPVTSSKLHTLQLGEYGNELYIARGSFMAASSTVNVHSVPPSSIPGLVLQRVDGEGSLVLKISGQPILKTLGEGEQLFIQPNRLVAVESTTQVLGGPNTLLVNVVGPGKVVLQSLPSLEAAMISQAEVVGQALQAGGVSPGAMSSPFGGPMGMGGGLGSMLMQGAAFGVGSAIAHRAFDSAFGGPSAAAPVDQTPPATEAPPQDMSQQPDADISDNGSGGDGSFFGSMFGGDEGGDDGGDDGGDGDW